MQVMYPRTLLSRLTTVAAVIGILLVSLHSQADTVTSSQSRKIAVKAPTVAEQYLFDVANRERTQRGLKPLSWDPLLTMAARQHALLMVREGGISHQFSGEADLQTRTSAVGAHFSLIAENVAMAPTPIMLHDAWMHSEGHKRNLLEPSEDSVGIAVLWSHGELYAVEDFSRGVTSLSYQQQEQTVSELLKPYKLALADDTANARESCKMDTGYAGTRKPWFVMRYITSDLSLLPDELKSRLATGKYHQMAIGACEMTGQEKSFSGYSIAVLLYP